MSEPKTSKDLKQVDAKQLVKFYRALGELNTTLVTRLNRDPDSIADLIVVINDVIANLAYEQCAAGYRWDEVRAACVPENELG